MRRAPILTAMIVLMSVGACRPADPSAAPAVTATASPATPSAVPASGAPPSGGPASGGPASGGPASFSAAAAVAACKPAARAPRPGEAIDLDERAVKAIIDNAGRSGVATIEQAGDQVRDRYSAWLHANIGDEAAKALDDLLGAVGRVNEACVKAAVTVP
jgi:hypothetical protein